MSTPAVRGRYFEDFTLGQTLTSPARTVTEADIIIAFAALSGDWNAIHTDAEYAAATNDMELGAALARATRALRSPS